MSEWDPVRPAVQAQEPRSRPVAASRASPRIIVARFKEARVGR